jgi:hypothetical protein
LLAVPQAAWDALGWLGNLFLVVLGLLFLFNRKLAETVSNWHGFSPWWAVVPFGALVLIGLLQANYKRYRRLWEQIASRSPESVTQSAVELGSASFDQSHLRLTVAQNVGPGGASVGADGALALERRYRVVSAETRMEIAGRLRALAACLQAFEYEQRLAEPRPQEGQELPVFKRELNMYRHQTHMEYTKRFTGQIAERVDEATETGVQAPEELSPVHYMLMAGPMPLAHTASALYVLAGRVARGPIPPTHFWNRLRRPKPTPQIPPGQ